MPRSDSNSFSTCTGSGTKDLTAATAVNLLNASSRQQLLPATYRLEVVHLARRTSNSGTKDLTTDHALNESTASRISTRNTIYGIEDLTVAAYLSSRIRHTRTTQRFQHVLVSHLTPLLDSNFFPTGTGSRSLTSPDAPLSSLLEHPFLVPTTAGLDRHQFQALRLFIILT